MFVRGISFSYLFELSDNYLEMSYPMDISLRDILQVAGDIFIIKFHSAGATGPCRLGSLAAPSDPGCPGLLRRTLHHCDAPLLSRSHRRTGPGPPDQRGLPAQTATALLLPPPLPLPLSTPPSIVFSPLLPLPLFTPPAPPRSEYSSGQSIFRAMLGRARARHPSAAPRAVALH